MNTPERRVNRRYPDNIRTFLVDKFEEYRSVLIEEMREAPSITNLLFYYMGKVRWMVADMRKCSVPKEIRQAIVEIIAESFDLLRELGKESGHYATAVENGQETTEEVASKVVIEKTKAVAKIVLPRIEVEPIVPFEALSADIKRGTEKITDPELRAGVQALLTEIRFPSKQATETEEEHRALLEQVGLKGGGGRSVLKIYVYLVSMGILPLPPCRKEPFSKAEKKRAKRLLIAELRLTDKDVVMGPAVKKERKWAIAEEMGADPEGVDHLKEWNLPKYMGGRDVTMNQVMYTERALYFTQNAWNACVTGVIHSAAARARTLFGVDMFYHRDRVYVTNKIVHRLIKLVVEGKADSFQMPLYNKQVAMGVYWLVVIRRMVGKPNQNEKIAKIWDCARQMEQTTSTTPAEFIRECAELRPDFSFRRNQSIEDIARWILGKYTTAAFRTLKTRFGISPDWGYTETSDAPFTVTPTLLKVTPEQMAGIDQIIGELLDRALEKQYPSPV